MRSNKFPPGPRGHFLLGSFPLGSHDSLQLLADWAKRYGDILHYRVLTAHVYFVNHPDLIESVLASRSRNFVKGRGLQVNRRLFGNGLLTSEGETWLRHRRLCQPAFHRERLEGYAGTMVEFTRRMMADWREGESRNLEGEMRQLTLRIVVRALFGAEMGASTAEVGQALQPIMEFNRRGRILIPLLRYLPTPLSVRYRLAVRRLEGIVRFILRQRAPTSHRGDDLLSMLLEARDENGSGLSGRELRDEVMTFLLAGHETTALTLCWTFYLLARHPAVERQLWREMDAVLEGRPPEARDLERLAYAQRVVKESMRLCPPAYAIARVAMQDCEVGGYKVPRGASVVASQWVMHRDPRFFDHPEQFRPERWTEEFTARLPKFAYFPFGGGPRLCIGAPFAMMEAILVMVTILQRFHLQMPAERVVAPVPAITLRPGAALEVTLARRLGASLPA